MIRDALRAALVIAVMAAGSALLVETRYQMAAIDAAHRNLLAGNYAQPQQPLPYQSETSPGPLRRLGRSAMDFADAALGIVR